MTDRKDKEINVLTNANDYKKEVSIGINPSEENLYAKLIDLEEEIAVLDDPNLSPDKRKILEKIKRWHNLTERTRRWITIRNL